MTVGDERNAFASGYAEREAERRFDAGGRSGHRAATASDDAERRQRRFRETASGTFTPVKQLQATLTRSAATAERHAGPGDEKPHRPGRRPQFDERRLNGSIATTHEELAALQKRGERNYLNSISRNRDLSTGRPAIPFTAQADAKNKSYDIAMVVDDNQLTKEKINLYEPVWIHRTDDPQPVQIVVNKSARTTSTDT